MQGNNTHETKRGSILNYVKKRSITVSLGHYRCIKYVCMRGCVCVCVSMREREREIVYVRMCECCVFVIVFEIKLWNFEKKNIFSEFNLNCIAVH